MPNIIYIKSMIQKAYTTNTDWLLGLTLTGSTNEINAPGPQERDMSHLHPKP